MLVDRFPLRLLIVNFLAPESFPGLAIEGVKHPVDGDRRNIDRNGVMRRGMSGEINLFPICNQVEILMIFEFRPRDPFQFRTLSVAEVNDRQLTFRAEN